MIIHISGPSGSGKTTLGNKLKEKFREKIIVKDTDDLREEFIKSHYGDEKWDAIDKDAYQKYIDKYINKHKKPLVFVGLNNMPWWHKDHYYDMHSTYNYYIEIDDMLVVKQKCLRWFKWMENISENEVMMKDLMENNNKFVRITQDQVAKECGADETIKMNKQWNNDYAKQGYKFMPPDEIYNEVVKLLEGHIGGYYRKYQKYKKKYRSIKGGSNLIIHISGAQGSGKTTMGVELKEKYGNKIIVKDMDEMMGEYNGDNFQGYLNEYLFHIDKITIITGLTAERCLGDMDNNNTGFYKIDTPYRYYIDENNEIILKQRFFRQINKLNQRKEQYFEMWKNDPRLTTTKLIRFVNIDEWERNNEACRKIHINQGYKFMSKDEIKNKIEELIS